MTNRSSIYFSALLLAAAAHQAQAQTACTMAHAKEAGAVAGLSVAPIANLQASVKVPDGVALVSGKQIQYCVVTGSVPTDKQAGSSANFAVALPTRWTGRYLFTGCGGYCGSVGLLSDDTARGSLGPSDALAKGYAVVATDDGHVAGGFGASWALKDGKPNDAALIDFGDRAVHAVAQSVRQFVQQWYGKPVAHAYFYGCSDGGRESMMEASRYPDDFDGYIAGAPFFDVPAEILSGQAAQAMAARETSYIPPALLSVVDRAFKKECDAKDGVQDGLIQNPALCAVEPKSLVCKAGDTSDCLSADQAHTLERWLSAVRDTKGKLLAYGYSASDIYTAGESGASLALWAGALHAPTNPGGAQPWTANQTPPGWLFYDESLRYLVFRDASFNSNAHSVVSDDNRVTLENYRLLAERTAFARSDNPAKLQAFMKSDRKLIMFHGFSDGFINPYRTMQYYKDLSEQNGGYGATSQHARLFMAPGVYHCGGGPGPNSFNTLSALERWVEQGQAPATILATKEDPKSHAVTRTMPLCPFPAEAHFSGQGDVNDAENWSCSNKQELLDSGKIGRKAGW